ncbi:hypothetical protein F7734_24570 [Scytonema sp. UIC 10036]|nr:hypothetical protein [Scytonema sp. UIC 10036]
MNNPKRGKIWMVQFDPTRGQEIQKTPPAVVISSNMLSTIAMRIIVPVTTWQPKFPGQTHHVNKNSTFSITPYFFALNHIY